MIAATNKDLKKEVAEGRFEDLYFRLTPLSVHVPPLRERKDDIPLLARHILDNFRKKTGKEVAGVSRPAQAASWPRLARQHQGARKCYRARGHTRQRAFR
ncbi:MAG: sigma 54-interacting transcriptional regulator [Deltaproteobacteria bacterium]|nr:sigma 54-interacting transcriptional regulator [Deltaproteobacteria bacterium]